jgi:hypothetical protein
MVNGFPKYTLSCKGRGGYYKRIVIGKRNSHFSELNL